MVEVTREMAEAAALRWATMDGKKERFLDDKVGKLGDDDGCFEGYVAEATEILNAALSAIPQPVAVKPPFEFDRYINGTLMAEGVTVELQDTLEGAMRVAARIASRGPKGEVPVLVLRTTPPSSLREENERLREDMNNMNDWCMAFQKVWDTLLSTGDMPDVVSDDPVVSTLAWIDALKDRAEAAEARATAAETLLKKAREALKEAHPYVETLHSLIGKGDTRKQVWGVIKNIRDALQALEERG